MFGKRVENRRGKETADERNCPRGVIGVKNLGRELQNNKHIYV